MFAAAQLAGAGNLSLSGIADECPSLMTKFARLDPIETASTFSMLLCLPELQSNCIRLESLAHLALAHCRGQQKPPRSIFVQAFATLGRGTCGRMEDPAEDVFVTSVATPRGNYRVLLGVWETAGFYLQRLINVVEAMPQGSGYDEMRDQIYALLGISELLCARAELARNDLGDTTRHSVLPRDVDVSKAKRDIVHFKQGELSACGIDPMHLSPFVFDADDCPKIQAEDLGHTSLERRPVVVHEGDAYLILPTAVSAAIRRFVVEKMEAGDMRSAVVRGIANEYAAAFFHERMLGGRSRAPIDFRRTAHGMISGVSFAADLGRWVNLVFVVDTLEDFGTTGLCLPRVTPIGLGQDVSKLIEEACLRIEGQPGFRDGITIVVLCGIGRGIALQLPKVERPQWRLEMMSAADLATLSSLSDFTPLSLWRVFEAFDLVSKSGVELQNINGFLNLVAWSRMLDGHLVPHGRLPDDFGSDGCASLIVIEQNALRELRHEVAVAHDIHAEKSVDGHWKLVGKDGGKTFEEERLTPLYICLETAASARGPAGVFVTRSRPWWCEIEVPQGTSTDHSFQRWMVVMTWVARAVPELERWFHALPDGPILWVTRFLETVGNVDVDGPLRTFADARSGISATANCAAKTIEVVVGEPFESAIFNADNVAERALVDGLVEAAALLSGEVISAADREAMVDRITQGTQARYSHAFRAATFRDRVQGSRSNKPILIDQADDAALRLGLGWSVRARSAGAMVKGKPDCMAFLNALVGSLEDRFCAELQRFNQEALILMAIQNHEAAAREREQWHRTAAALLALSNDKRAALDTMARHDFKLNAVYQATRILVEFAVCECPQVGGEIPGVLDLGRLMTFPALLFGVGGWSDAIRWDVMEPTLRVTPLGDVHADWQFSQQVVGPHARRTSDTRINEAADGYARHLEEPTFTESVHHAFDPKFLAAWEEQSGASLDDFRLFIEHLENVAFLANEVVLKLPGSTFLDVEIEGHRLSPATAETILEFLTLLPRQRWREVPDGYAPRDIHPWRFRRRLSVLRKPIIQLDDGANHSFVVAPGLLRDSFNYQVGNFLRGDFPEQQLSPKMRSWKSVTEGARGSIFSLAVAERMIELGWQAEPEVKVTKLLQRGFDRDYGDVDVLAWNPSTGRVLVIECKDVQYRLTDGEIAEQLSDFRGETDANGKRDYLRRHLDRIDVISENLSAVARYVKMDGLAQVESHLLFKNPVPMQFALEHMARQVTVSVFDELYGLS